MKTLSAIKRFAHLPELEAHEIGRPHFRMQNPLAGGLGDFVVQPIWDGYFVKFNTACVTQTLFSIPQGNPFTITGGATFTKTKQTTSMVKAAELPAPERLLVRGITAFTDNNMNQADQASLCSQFYMNFFISTKSFFEMGVLGKIPGGGGAWAQQFGATAATTIIGVTGNGMPTEHQGFALTDPGAAGFSPTNDPDEIKQSTFPQIDGVLITQQQNFGVLIDPTLAAHIAAVGFTTANNTAVPPGIGINLFVYLQGNHVRAVL